MDRKGWKGSVTIFFSLTCILFLCLICSIVESARFQGARAQTANIAGVGTFSLLGEFEQKLLENYDIFALDASYGKGKFQKKTVSQRLENFVSCNTNPKDGLLTSWCFDLWNLALTDCEVTDYVLLTDEKGEAFYQQAVAYMKTNLGTAAVGKLLDFARDAESIEKKQEEYEENKSANENELSSLEDQKQQKLEQLESEAAEKQPAGTIEIIENGGEVSNIGNAEEGLNANIENGTGEDLNGVIQITGDGAAGQGSQEIVPTVENPLPEISKLRRRSVLEIVTWDKAISDKKISKSGLPSKGTSQKGTYKLEKEYSGLLANVLFREYLLEYFPNYLDGSENTDLAYQIEYILGGKTTDRDNLKYVVYRLLLLREAMNYLYCVNQPQMSAQAESLSVALTGFLGIAPLTTATKHALLLAWAYGESLIDVRILLDGGKVPIRKDIATWSLALENLGRIVEILNKGAADKGKGLDYQDYLRLLLYMSSVSKQKQRGLDLIQLNLQKEKGMEKFKAENCIVAVKTKTEWHCKPVFSGLPMSVMGISSDDFAIVQKSSMAY